MELVTIDAFKLQVKYRPGRSGRGVQREILSPGLGLRNHLISDPMSLCSLHLIQNFMIYLGFPRAIKVYLRLRESVNRPMRIGLNDCQPRTCLRGLPLFFSSVLPVARTPEIAYLHAFDGGSFPRLFLPFRQPCARCRSSNG